jgi:hypothetical protein
MGFAHILRTSRVFGPGEALRKSSKPLGIIESGRQDSNLRPSAPKAENETRWTQIGMSKVLAAPAFFGGVLVSGWR